MRAFLQRVLKASVSIDQKLTAKIGTGILILVGIEEADNLEDVIWLSGKIVRLRIFPDNNGIMNLPIKEINGEILVVSQFTLHASTKKGNRPSYIRSAKPETAIPLYEAFIKKLEKDLGKPVQTGDFGAMMQVSLINDGPVTIMMDSKAKE